MFCGRDVVVRFGPQAKNFFERTLDFLHSPPRAKNNLDFFGGSKCCHIYTFFTQLAAGEKNRGFLKSKWFHIYTFFIFWGSKWCHIYTFLIFFGQNAAIYTHFGRFFWSKCYHMYTFCGVFGVKNAAIYTHFWNLIFPEKAKKKTKFKTGN